MKILICEEALAFGRMMRRIWRKCWGTSDFFQCGLSVYGGRKVCFLRLAPVDEKVEGISWENWSLSGICVGRGILL
ncbi:MAG: hypothetical protein ACLVAW_05435 [Eisenbergiella massiliensis]